MKALVFATVAALAAFDGRAGDPGDRAASCVTCHGEQARVAASSVHASAGIDCISCHGGVGGELDVAKAHGSAMNALKTPRTVVESCGGCHSDVERMRAFGLRTDQLVQYWTSRHGAKVATDDDPRVATCVDCHGSHGTVRVQDPTSPVHPRRQPQTCGKCHADQQLMASYGLPSDQVEQFTSSVHGRALLIDFHPAAPACTDCHGSHGTQPPRAADVETVCGQCHNIVQSFYDESPHATGASKVACTACHGDHGVAEPSPAMFVGDDERHCGNCHTTPGEEALAIGAQLRQDVERLQSTIRDAQGVVDEAGSRGLFLGDERGYIEEARGLLVRARTMTHTLSPAALDDVLNRGQAMVQTMLESLATKQRTFRDRRIFTAIFLGLTFTFAVALLLYARELSGRWKRSRSARSSGASHV